MITTRQKLMNETTLLSWANQATAMAPYHDPRFPPSIYYRFLKVLAQELQPSLSVELGVCGGGGSFHLAQGYPGGVVVGVDVSIEYPDNLAYIERTCPNFKFWRGDSVKSAGDVFREYGPARILFIDTVHTKLQTQREFDAWFPYLTGDAIVCFDDLFRPTMPDFWHGLPGNKLRLDVLHDGSPGIGGGFGIWWR